MSPQTTGLDAFDVAGSIVAMERRDPNNAAPPIIEALDITPGVAAMDAVQLITHECEDGPEAFDVSPAIVSMVQDFALIQYGELPEALDITPSIISMTRTGP